MLNGGTSGAATGGSTGASTGGSSGATGGATGNGGSGGVMGPDASPDATAADARKLDGGGTGGVAGSGGASSTGGALGSGGKVGSGGAMGSGGTSGSTGTTVSYAATIAPMISASCSCHVSGSQSPPLGTYTNLKNNVTRANNAIQGGSMPPGGALNATQKANFQAWVTAGSPNN